MHLTIKEKVCKSGDKAMTEEQGQEPKRPSELVRGEKTTMKNHPGYTVRKSREGYVIRMPREKEQQLLETLPETL
jgi:hypothetical protein